MDNINGSVVAILKDGLGVISGQLIGTRRTDFGDYLVLESAGDFTPEGELVDNQVAVGKVEHLVLESNEAFAFATNRFDSAYSIGVPPGDGYLPEDQDGAAAAAVETVVEDPVAMAVGALPIISSAEGGGTIGEDVGQGGTTEDTLVDSGEPIIEEGDGPTAGIDQEEANDDDDDRASLAEDGTQASGDGVSDVPGEGLPAVKKAPRAKKTD